MTKGWKVSAGLVLAAFALTATAALAASKTANVKIVNKSQWAIAEMYLSSVDDEAWGGTRRLHLDATPGGATCRPTDRSPDLTLPVAALGGAYLGGTRLRDLVLATGADEHRPGALAEADALLRTAEEPWCSTFF